MEDIRMKKEFIYCLGNEYYLIGRCACEKCNDEGLVAKYKNYQDVCDCEDFNACKSMDDVRNIPRYTRNVIADAYDEVAKTCRAMCVENRIDDNARALMDRLEERYSDEIQKQISRWLIAYRCVDFRDAERLSRQM